ncbi:hypothetical protein ACFFQW_49390 [Umezawaea endophytica]|uniref:Uncharacterized protein n=1 Tax=Umezawaea endophytica TaxID=1654476 RepID=A0A9X2VJC0_9PSEU|nr:hypothetical protein [Umezawaea endophytica]MCS7477770.1 hypothetical protein [Umezawaea endophytica]
MSAPTEDRGQLVHPVLGDLAQWHDTFLAYAAAAPTGNEHFAVPHVAVVPFEPGRMCEGLALFEARYGALVGPGLLPELATMRKALARGGRRGGGERAHRHPHDGAGVTLSGGGLDRDVELAHGGVEAYDEGSPCHNFWHWLTGTS